MYVYRPSADVSVIGDVIELNPEEAVFADIDGVEHPRYLKQFEPIRMNLNGNVLQEGMSVFFFFFCHVSYMCYSSR